MKNIKNIKEFNAILISIAIIIPLLGIGYLYFQLNSMYDKEEAKEISTTQESEKNKKNGITNILLVGVDGNNIEKGNRSDSMMILTIDEKNQDIRLTSLARDTYVDIEGYGSEKLTHAYAYEGASLLIQTIKNNFGIDVDKYVAVSFESFEKIIDILDGIEINVSKKEVSQINGIKKSGTQTLNGSQALEYSRIRYIDSAYERDNRQRKVIEALYNKLVNDSNGNLMSVLNEVLRYTKTNMLPLEIVSIANKAIKINDTEFDQVEFPFKEARKDNNIKEKGWIIEWDKDYNKNKLDKFIYDYANYDKSDSN
ncbi:Cell envelope-related transcriptional regulator [Romboutsia ilealis]|uniref:Cell envelope-related transcriptional regulator n=1 Tax=Romboutsia ilealis TaxID=1115758 RepID=A0A1V1I078_9FIRM|nr:LCP family protein [Romboutsia ilealis]CED93553.1 Cell envelope-related transcriptional regulator [Romboutsia ilealis]